MIRADDSSGVTRRSMMTMADALHRNHRCGFALLVVGSSGVVLRHEYADPGLIEGAAD